MPTFRGSDVAASTTAGPVLDLPRVDPAPTAPTPSTTPSTTPRERILVATIVCLARYGVAKTTLDDVAHEAGCARATVYRYFPGKRALVLAAADAEADAIVARTVAAGAGAGTIEDALTAMMTTAARAITEHAALQLALAHEPELVLPHLSFEGGDALLTEAGRRFGPAIARFLRGESVARAERLAEWCTRLLLTQLHAETPLVSMTDEAAVRGLLRRFVLPGLPVAASGSDASPGR
jgi:AcrR family transcriptional regulator